MSPEKPADVAGRHPWCRIHADDVERRRAGGAVRRTGPRPRFPSGQTDGGMRVPRVPRWPMGGGSAPIIREGSAEGLRVHERQPGEERHEHSEDGHPSPPHDERYGNRDCEGGDRRERNPKVHVPAAVVPIFAGRACGRSPQVAPSAMILRRMALGTCGIEVIRNQHRDDQQEQDLKQRLRDCGEAQLHAFGPFPSRPPRQAARRPAVRARTDARRRGSRRGSSAARTDEDFSAAGTMSRTCGRPAASPAQGRPRHCRWRHSRRDGADPGPARDRSSGAASRAGPTCAGPSRPFGRRSRRASRAALTGRGRPAPSLPLANGGAGGLQLTARSWARKCQLWDGGEP